MNAQCSCEASVGGALLDLHSPLAPSGHQGCLLKLCESLLCSWPQGLLGLSLLSVLWLNGLIFVSLLSFPGINLTPGKSSRVPNVSLATWQRRGRLGQATEAKGVPGL